MSFIGLDPKQVRANGTAIQARADDIARMAAELERIVQTMPWSGHDADLFKHEWWPEKRHRLTQIAERLHGLGQSAINNAAEQEQVSSVAGGAAVAGAGLAGAAANKAGQGAAPPAATTAPSGGKTGATSGNLPPSTDGPNRTDGYAKAGLGYYGPTGDSAYQCTAWANFRWHELGYTGPNISGNGGEMAGYAGNVSTTPTLGAMGSYGSGYGHVVIVEGISTDANGVMHIKISEGNALGLGGDIQGLRGGEGVPAEWGTTRELTRNADGTWSSGSKNEGVISFAAFRTS